MAALAFSLARAGDAHAATFPFGESFSEATAPDFALGGAATLTANTGVDTAGNGWLRLTPASNDSFGYAYNKTAFPSADGISYEFDYAAWGGSGADGLAFVLFDGATTDAQFHAGPPGGALGYTRCFMNGGWVDGLSNAYLGLGFDVFGNFANSGVCQQSGLPGGQPNRITLRGGAPSYAYLDSVAATGGVGTQNRAGARRVSVTVLPKGGTTTITASVRYPNGSIQQIFDDYELPSAPPATLKFGFTASTGGSTNNHEIRGMRVSKPTDLQVEVTGDAAAADRDAVQGYTATIRNAGPNPATGVDLTVAMPEHDDVTWECTGSGGAVCPFASGVGMPDTGGAMPVGSELTYRITGTLVDGADDSQIWVAAEPTGDTAEMAPEDNTAEAQTDVTPELDASPTYTLSAAGLATATAVAGRGGHLTSSWQWLRCDPDGDDCEEIDGATSITYTTTSADRESNLRVRQTVTNDAGEASAVSSTTTLPTTTIVSGPASLTNSPSATFTFSASRPSSTFECRLDDDASWGACLTPLMLGDLEDGEHVLRVRAVYGGLAAAEPVRHDWTVDTVTEVAFVEPTAGPTNDPSPTIELRGEPDATWTLSLNGTVVDSGTFGPGGTATSSNVGPLEDGTHLLRVTSEDPAGNTDDDEVELELDTVAPSAPTVGDGPPPATSDTDAEVSFDVEPGTQAECRFAGGPWVPCSSPWTVSDLPDGPYVLEIRTTDDAGNTGEVIRHEWTVDTEDPLPPTWGELPAPTSSDPRPTLTFTGEPGSQAFCRVDDGPWEPCSSPWTAPGLDDGTHTVSVKIVDPAGNESPVLEHRWTVDTAPPPVPTVLAGPSGPTTSTTATFALAGEPGAAIECSLDGGAWVPCPATLVLNGLAVGDHVLRVRQTDAAGNVSSVGEHRWSVVAEAAEPKQPQTPTRATTRIAAKSTVTGASGTVRVGCAVNRGVLDRCEVKIYERKSNGKRGALLGVGTVRVSGEGRSATVSVRLNARGKRVVARSLGGRAVIVSSVATARGGKTLRAKAVRTRLYPERLLTVPTVLPFAIDRGVVQGAARRVVADVAPQLRRAKSVHCIGFTDSQGPAAHNKRLGQRRAEAVCRTLRQMGVRAKFRSSSRGEDQPRASNKTAAGRAKNRRVELVVRY